MDKSPINHRAAQSDRTIGFEVLIRRISEGSEEAVWEVLERYSTNILRVVRRHLPNELRPKIDSIDIVQSVWKSLLRKGDGFDHISSAEHFVGYIAACARNKVLETHRNFTRHACADIRREVPLTTDQRDNDGAITPIRDLPDRRADNPGDNATAREKWELAVQRAGERGQRVIQLRLQGMTLDEIAEETGMTKITVRRDLDAILSCLTA
ncbi:MAG TPA: sigma-70 family RNA polymerase sigma factor [Lacipirellula sp.]